MAEGSRIVVSLLAGTSYENALHRLSVAVAEKGGKVEPGRLSQLAEYAIARLAESHKIDLPRRMPRPGRRIGVKNGGGRGPLAR